MTVLNVGSNQPFQRIADAVAASQDGDVVNVQSGTYVNDFATINAKISINGVGGMVHLLATVAPPDGKAILTTNTDLSIDHLEFSGAQVGDQNGAGIRYQGGNLRITNSYFHDNQNGILGGAAPNGTISISTSEFAHNGAGDGYTHNIYIGDIASLTIDRSYFHDAVVGHEIKSRAEQTTITNSRIQDGPTGTASYSIDLPNGGATLIQNNVIEQGPQSQNPIIIAYGEEGNLHANTTLNVVGNTILNDLPSGSARGVWNTTSTPATLTNNAFYGLSDSQIVNGPANVSGSTVLSSEPALDTSSPVQTMSGSPIDTLVLHLSEDAWNGDAQFIASVDGNGLGVAQSVSALHRLGQSQDFTFKGQFGPNMHDIAVSFINDAYGGTPDTDRNLYVDSVDFNGTHYGAAIAALYANETVHFQIGTPKT